ncbi:HNH endonuclease [Gillisia sp. JM1]|uniref:HNH endonuclease n=1 Tax=Gillisia sp. JM1 TaxID=1283286 RepID=UPI000404D277|nr:HNH endonuclease [Gillisia sp. JM1]
MKHIDNIEELEQNLETVEFYLSEGTNSENDKTIKLIRAGACFVAYKISDELRFAPSRFVGYKNNKLEQHLNSEKDGRETNVVIERLMDNKLGTNEKLEISFQKYCLNLGIEPHKKKRKYWKHNLSQEFKANVNLDGEFPEGKISERKHKYRERNSKVAQIAKQNFKNQNGRLFCQVCEFDFEQEYGEIGADFIEAHHTIPVSEMQPGHITKIEDLAMLCPNCHRMAHKKRPWLKMTELKQLRKNANGNIN